jgi:hypothetical protein
MPATYCHGLKIRRYRNRRRRWRYDPTLHSERRNRFRRARSARNRQIQTADRSYFRYHFVLPTNQPLRSIQRVELPSPSSQSFALVISTPEATDTASARIFSITILDHSDLCPEITARTA